MNENVSVSLTLTVRLCCQHVAVSVRLIFIHSLMKILRRMFRSLAIQVELFLAVQVERKEFKSRHMNCIPPPKSGCYRIRSIKFVTKEATNQEMGITRTTFTKRTQNKFQV